MKSLEEFSKHTDLVREDDFDAISVTSVNGQLNGSSKGANIRNLCASQEVDKNPFKFLEATLDDFIPIDGPGSLNSRCDEAMFEKLRTLSPSLCRILDVLLASLAILILVPLFSIIVPILKFSGEGEILFRQTRVGRNGQPFSIIKFATMLKNSPNMTGGTITVYNDPRILPFGRLLRATKINELPQLFNVLVGDMSLVGPRPQALSYFLEFTDFGQEKITTVKPGLTGVGSIFSNEEKLLANFDGNHEELYTKHVVPYKEALEIWAIEQMVWRFISNLSC